MEEKMINHFDKKIEQAMNAYTEAPPFGMWNRISAELGEPVVAPVTPKPYSVFTRSSVLGFMSGVLLIGGIVTANMLYNVTSTSNSGKTEIAPSLPTALISPVEEVIVSPQVKVPSVTGKTFSPKLLTVNKQNALSASISESENRQEAVLETKEIQPEKAFYFPPVDIETSSEKLNEQSVEAAVSYMNHTTVFKESEKVEEKTAKVTNLKEQRLKFHPRKKRSHTWGTINRRNTKNK
jgi:hypothetical protein